MCRAPLVGDHLTTRSNDYENHSGGFCWHPVGWGMR